ncbi:MULTISPECIES: SHOCT domain-containing protein [unclassified Archaeoglobus]|jgi:putative membrane protein|uniref:SHOCT domain-containing protein n=1 Tax=unclassified Archaeoglobus TaxID=2643606 RepID=UPI0025B86457|nr:MULTISPECIES: SHOCT domain-containing protein [unclassified Archaeoglobus]
MDGFMHPYTQPFLFPFLGMGMLIWWIPLLIIAYLVYQDAEKRGMNGLLWFILIIIPMLGIIFLLIYVVLRESKSERVGRVEKTPLEILKERYARGEITEEEYRRMREELEK